MYSFILYYFIRIRLKQKKAERKAKKLQKKQAKAQKKQESIDVRGQCVRRILLVLIIQLSITATILWALATIKVVDEFFTKYYIPILIVSLIGTYAISCTLKCVTHHPLDWLMLLSFTICQSLLGSSCIHFMDHRVMIGGVVITIIAIAALALFAYLVKSDLSGITPYILVLLVVAVCFSFATFLDLIPLNIFVYILVPIFSIYVIIDIQTGVKLNVIGEKYTLDVYVNVCALQVYADLFTFMKGRWKCCKCCV